MEHKAIVIFLDYFESLEKVVPIIRKISTRFKCRPIIVTLNFYTKPLTDCLDFKVIYFDGFLSRDDYDFMDRYVYNLAETWYEGLKSSEGITAHKGIQFGALIEERAQLFFTAAIKKLQIALKIIENLQPHIIILIGEKDVFEALAVFIEKEIKIPSLFIEFHEEKRSVKKAVKKIYRFIAETFGDICDILVSRIMILNRKNNGIFIDTQLYSELKDLRKSYQPYLYLLERGLRVRLKLIMDENALFAPILPNTFLKFPDIFGQFYKYYLRFIKTDEIFKNRFVYKDLVIWQILEKSIKRLIINDFSQARKNVLFLERLYKNLKPKIIILREAVRSPEKTIVFTARQAGIPTLVIQHGILITTHVFRKLHSDKIALWGRVGVDLYAASGNEMKKCFVTGKLQHDLHYLKKNDCIKEGEAILSRLGADPRKETILYIASFFKDKKYFYSVHCYHDSEFISLDSITEVAADFPEKQFIVKVHPYDLIDMEILRNDPKIKKYPNIFVVKDVDIIPLIKISSLVIASQFSSSALDAVIFNKPIIVLNFYKREELVPFAQRGVALEVADPGELSQAVTRIYTDRKLADWMDSSRGNFIYDYAYRIDGKATERILDLIKALTCEFGSSGIKDLENKKINSINLNNKNEHIISKSSM